MEAVAGTSDWLVFWVVAVARLLLPLAIPRYPLPGILASLVLDGVDQSIFQQFTALPLEGYQGYDKALDVYYLSVAYITTLRNWENRFAIQVSRLLLYWRLVGVALFEVTHMRALLLIFPNTFEYFFIYYETYRLRWDPRLMTHKLVAGAVAIIWIAIKLPQEYWIHIGQHDMTDSIKVGLLHFPSEVSWSEILRRRPAAPLGLLTIAILIVIGAWRFVRRRLPPADRALALSAAAHRPAFTEDQAWGALASEARHIVDGALVEKVALTTLVSLSFAQVLPEVRATDFQLTVGLALVVVANTMLSHWLMRRGFVWALSHWEFIVIGATNLVLILAYSVLRSRAGERVRVGNAVFFALLLALLVTLFDRYRQVYLMWHGSGGSQT